MAVKMPVLPSVQYLTIDQREIELHVRKHPRARRITLRYNPVDRHLVLTLPRRTPVHEGMSFIEERHKWIQKVLEEEHPRVFFEHDAVIPLMGVPHRIHHTPEKRGVVRLEDGVLQVSGAKEHLPRRMQDWLKQHVREYLQKMSHAKAAQINKNVKRVIIRDSRSRWGSCTSNGHLSFSWRLVFAPNFVIDYIVAHEVAHLVEMNHSKRFWKTVEILYPNWEEAETWLKRNAAQLYRYGA